MNRIERFEESIRKFNFFNEKVTYNYIATNPNYYGLQKKGNEQLFKLVLFSKSKEFVDAVGSLLYKNGFQFKDEEEGIQLFETEEEKIQIRSGKEGFYLSFYPFGNQSRNLYQFILSYFSQICVLCKAFNTVASIAIDDKENRIYGVYSLYSMKAVGFVEVKMKSDSVLEAYLTSVVMNEIGENKIELQHCGLNIQ